MGVVALAFTVDAPRPFEANPGIVAVRAKRPIDALEVRIDGKRGWGVLLCFTSATALTELETRARSLAAPTQGPETQPWHTRELVVTDPDGYRLNFVQPV